MKWWTPAATGWVILAVFCGAVAFDVWLYLAHGSAHTVSAVLEGWGQRTRMAAVVLAFAAGVLIGHCFFGEK